MRRLSAATQLQRRAVVVLAAVLAGTLAVAAGHTALAHRSARYGAPVALAAVRQSSTVTPSPPTPVSGTSGSGTSDPGTSAPGTTTGEGPPPLRIGPPGITARSTPAPAVRQGSAGQGSPGPFNITGHVEAAIDGWFRSLVTEALDSVLSLLGHTLLATPDVTATSQISQLWRMTEGIADAFLVLFVLAGGAIVMTHETLQSRTALGDILPRVVVAAVAVNASLGLASLAITTADALSLAVLGQGVTATGAGVVLRRLLLGSLSSGGNFVVILGLVVAVLAVVLLGTYMVRLAMVAILVVAAPICLVCHALPQTESLAKLWWRAFAATLMVQVAQSLVLVTALRALLTTAGTSNLGVPSSGGAIRLLICACLCWVMVKIPSWASRIVFSRSSGRGGVTRVVRDVVVYKGAKALVGGAAL